MRLTGFDESSNSVWRADTKEHSVLGQELYKKNNALIKKERT